jgi:tRNA A-37 threonylcarbamoyl transferase component Bud32
MWKEGIHHGDINLGNLMRDDARKAAIPDDFDLARFANRAGASGQDNTGTLPFMALDLLSEEGLCGEIPRRYRHEAESFAWSLICLYFATVEDKNGKNRTRDPHPLIEWFED